MRQILNEGTAEPFIARLFLGIFDMASHLLSQAEKQAFDEQMASILGACQEYPHRRSAARLRALVILLRFSGLRIRDAVTLSRDRIREGKLFLYTAKTGTPVWCPIPHLS
jgi:integrase